MTVSVPSWRLDNVRLLRGGKVVLQEVSCQIQPSRLTTLLGGNGAGKTSLLRVLAGLLPAASGRVDYQGEPLARLGAVRRAQEMAWVAQHPDHTLPFTVQEYVTLGRHPHRSSWTPLRVDERRLLEQVLQQVELLPLMHKPLVRLSGGERQRAALARALAQQTPCLLLDEPTNHLDLKHQHALQRLLQRLAQQGRTVVQVLHDLELAARYSDEVGLLVDGAILGWGRPESVLRADNLQQAYGLALIPETGTEGFMRFAVGSLG